MKRPEKYAPFRLWWEYADHVEAEARIMRAAWWRLHDLAVGVTPELSVAIKRERAVLHRDLAPTSQVDFLFGEREGTPSQKEEGKESPDPSSLGTTGEAK